MTLIWRIRDWFKQLEYFDIFYTRKKRVLLSKSCYASCYEYCGFAIITQIECLPAVFLQDLHSFGIVWFGKKGSIKHTKKGKIQQLKSSEVQ